MAQYNNTLGFFAGNEVSNTVQTTNASAFVKAAARDMKTYIKQKGYRSIGVGYATNDDSSIRVNMADYFNCDTSEDGIDFWGYNIYSWCGDSSYHASGHKERTEEFKNYSVPVFFAKYGCNAVQPRKFTEVDALYGDTMADAWSPPSTAQASAKWQTSPPTPSTSLTPLPRESTKPIPPCNRVPRRNQLGSQSLPAPAIPGLGTLQLYVHIGQMRHKDSISGSKYSGLFGVVCGYTDCSGVSANGTTGDYGAYMLCGPKDQLNFIVNRYYEEQDSNTSACDFGDSATTTSTTKARGSCKSLMSQAGSAGTGTVTLQPTASGGAAAGLSGGASASQGAAAAMAPGMKGGWVQFGLYAVTAMFAGLGMMLL